VTGSHSSAHIVLVVPPFAHAAFPVLGPSILKAQCLERGLSAAVVYGNLDLAKRVGYERYSSFALTSRDASLAESLFFEFAFPDESSDGSRSPQLLERNGDSPWAESKVCGFYGAPEAIRTEDLELCSSCLPGFLDSCVDQVLARSPKVVGFSALFQQTLPSIALARELKRRQPQIVTVFGGASATSPMGRAIAELTGFFDYVFSGPADIQFPEFCCRLLEKGERPLETVLEGAAVPDLDRLSIPDFHDYFSQLRAEQQIGGLPEELPNCLHFEASRGCWWGEKTQCAFCGLNGRQIGYHFKSAERILAEISVLSDTYDIKRLYATDNVISRVMRDKVVPKLASQKNDYHIFCEVRPDLSRREIGLFSAAGIDFVQAGIESLNTNVLRQFGKGTTAPQNLVFLRDCVAGGITVVWNLLLGVPGEKREDYESLLTLIPRIEHFAPPRLWGPIRVDRFSRYHSDPGAFGMRNLRPDPSVARLFPKGAPLEDLAYHFEVDYTTELLDDSELLASLAQALAGWRSCWQAVESAPRLTAVDLGHGLTLVHDTRSCAIDAYHVCDPEVSGVLEQLEEPRRPERLDKSEHALVGELERRGFVIELEGWVLSLLTRPDRAAFQVGRCGEAAR
jgi:ribosomal peptide maturation radical SAM protein 1